MKKSLRRIISLALVMALLLTSMIVSSVGAATTDPMQEVLLAALKLDETGKEEFNAALTNSDADALHTLFPTMSAQDAALALGKYNTLTGYQKSLIQTSVFAFTLNTIPSSEVASFSTIATKVNKEITGDAGNYDGISLMVQIIEYLNYAGKNGAWVTDLTSDISKIDIKYDAGNSLVNLAVESVNVLITSMETLSNKISSSSGATAFDKLLSYTEEQINGESNTEIKALKDYLNAINDSYYIPYVAPSTGSTPTPTPTATPVPKDVTAALDELKNTVTNSGTEQNALKKAAEAAIEKEIAKAGTVEVTPTVVGTTATVTADQIKVEDIIAKADAVIAKAAELAKAAGDAKVNIEKKVVIDVASTNAATVNVGLPSDLFAKIQEKGIAKIEIASGNVKLNVAPDFVSDIKDSKEVSFDIAKVAVTDELKSKMSEEQKSLLAANATVFDFNAAVVLKDGTQKSVSSFDKAITIKVKYDLKAGESKDKITVLYLADDGSVKNMVGRYDELSKEVIFETNHFSTYVVKNLVKTFNDVEKSAWYKTQAESLAAKGIVAGRTGNNFVPNGDITRAEFVTMLVKAKGVYDENATSDFIDVSEDAWYATYVASAVKAGIASGKGGNKFVPNGLITREEMAVMLANALGEKTVDNASSYLKASDADKISSYAKNGVALCVKNDFIVGNNNKLDPQGKATRGMAAVVVYKYFNFIY